MLMTSSPPDLSKLRLNREEAPGPREGSARLPWLVGGLAVLAVASMLWLVLAPRGPEVRVALAEATGGGKLSSDGISANGYVVARTKASVSAKTSGRLEYLGVHEGSTVRRGEVIARIKSADYRAALAAARAERARVAAELAQARRDLERAKSLHGRLLLSQAELEAASTRAGMLEAQLQAEGAREWRSRLPIWRTRACALRSMARCSVRMPRWGRSWPPPRPAAP